MNDQDYMKRCFELAKFATGNVAPNPLVGAIIVMNNQVIAEGYHKAPGLAHAELDAIQNANCDLTGATIYCNLEPCCHTNKRTPPCAQRIIKEGFAKVVISNLDPNPQVAGTGVKLLRDAGIEVVTGIMESEGQQLNEIFFHHIVNKRPFVHLKMAQTLDGKLASKTMDSKWITSTGSRENVHQERNHYDAIMVGAKTLRQDNPTLTVRIGNKPTKAIKRIILSLSGKLDKSLNVFTDDYKELTYVVVPELLNSDFEFKTIKCPLNELGEFNISVLLDILYRDHQITSVFVEGGQQVHTSFIHQHLYDRISVYIAPKILGEGHNTIGDLGHEIMADAVEYKNLKWKQIGNDVMFTARR